VSLAPDVSPLDDAGEAHARPLAILCGAGDFPVQVARAAIQRGRGLVMIGIVGAADQRIEAFPHIWIHLGELGKLFGALKQRGVGEIAIVGAVIRPEPADLRLDWGALKRLTSLAPLFRGGDNHLMSGVARLFESEGVRVVGVQQIAPQLLAPAGPLSAHRPSDQAHADAVRGGALIGALSPFDAGQAAVIANGRVLAIEAAEGTDAMLARIGELRASRRLRLRGRAGVLVKAPKRDQDMRLDLPAVGAKTIEGASRAGLEGVAVAAGRVLIADRESFARAADAAGLFVFGLEI
jgi:DUF1009 family protein